ncbi:MAG: type II toxin-antitoxin system RelE/ParE family toxin [Lachnospiraceae bacterium]|nr:type II toxin-antitoxin system RelE/ParE family toxin [Lachnospiraceae bacterium]
MHKVYFYQDKGGKQPVLDYLKELSKKKDKSSRIKFNKINDYIQALSIYGTALGEPYLKYLGENIWELRPLRDRILFVAWDKDSFVLLHYFMKKTQKTPMREIERARRELADLKERGIDNGK